MSCLKEVDFARIAPHQGVRSLRGGRLAIKPNPRARWFWHVEDVGFCAIHYLANGGRRLKAVYVFPEWRGFGYGRDMVDARIEICRADPASRWIDTFALAESMYLARGFERAGRNRNGTSRLILRL